LADVLIVNSVGLLYCMGARGSIVGWGTMIQPGRSLDFFNWPNPSSRTMALELTQPLTEMSTRNLPGGKGQPAGHEELERKTGPFVSRVLWTNTVNSIVTWV
jgi:hypothetical protein